MFRREDKSTFGDAGTPSTNAPWSVRAEFTIHRPDERSTPVEVSNRTATIAPTTESTGVRMTYSFVPNQAVPVYSSPSTSMSPPGTYGFQRGNLLFTSTPPTRSSLPARSHTIPRTGNSHAVQREQQQLRFQRQSTINYPDSDYSTESLPFLPHSSLPSIRPNDMRCKSTYNIVLSSASKSTTLGSQQQHKQAQLPYPRPWSSFYQRHQSIQQHVPPFYHISTVPEICEECVETFSSENLCTTPLSTKLLERTVADCDVNTVATATISRDAASQTTDIEAQHSPLATRRKVRKKIPGVLTGSSGRDELKNNNFGRISKTSASIRSPTPPADHTISDSSTDTNTTNTKEDNSEKRKRTVHIDVYCTGTDDDLNDEDNENNTLSVSSSEADTNLTQMTVFDNKNIRITHTESKSSVLPRGFQDEKAFMKRATERRCESFKQAPMRMPSLASSKGYESDDVLSSLYPSQFSSYSRLKDFDSSVPWSTASSSVGLAADGYDSASATSWKDTVSDMESLINSRASIITPSDSFEYADSLDQERIKRLSYMSAKKAIDGRFLKSRNSRLPYVEPKHLFQEKTMKEYVERHSPVGWSSDSSEAVSGSDEDSSDEVGWSFVSSEENASIVQGKLTLTSQSDGTAVVDKTSITQINSYPTTDQETSQAESTKEVKKCIFREKIGPFGSVSPTPPPSKLSSRMTSPFTTPQGEKTEHIIKASIFGRVINTFKKPGHHVGPAKNPACSCEHCRRYFEETARGRSRSLDTVERRNFSRAPSSTKS